MVLGLNVVKAQAPSFDDKTSKADEVNIIIKSKNYVFEDEHTPIPGEHYNMKVSANSVMTKLPEKDKAGANTDNTIQFTSTDFTYNCTPGKNGGWDVTIVPNGNITSANRDIKKLYLHINPMGYASLNIKTDRDMASYSGYIKQRGY